MNASRGRVASKSTESQKMGKSRVKNSTYHIDFNFLNLEPQNDRPYNFIVEI